MSALLTTLAACEDKSVLQSRIAGELQRLTIQLDTLDPRIRLDFPEVAYDQDLRALSLTASYHFVPRRLRQYVDCIRSNHGEEAVSLYLRLILCFAIHESLPVLTGDRASTSGIGTNGFPETVIRFYFRHFDWILRNLLEHLMVSPDYFDCSNDLFLKDLNVCNLRMFPMGAHVVEHLWVSTRFITQNGWMHFFKAASFYFGKMKASNTPFYHVHLDDRWLADFNRSGWLSFLRITAEMLQRHPHVRGLFGSSWFFDPSLERVSPGLLYLRKVPELGGAKLFRMGSTSQDMEMATRTSDRRKLLCREGTYVPTRYVFIWARDDLIRWAEQFTEPLAVHGFTDFKTVLLN